MLLAQSAMLCILVRLLGDGFVNRDHLALAGVARVCLTLLTGLFQFRQKGLLDLLEVIKQVTDTPRHRVLLKFVLGLSGPGAHMKNMACKIGIVNGPDLLGGLGCTIALIQTGQYLKVVI